MVSTSLITIVAEHNAAYVDSAQSIPRRTAMADQFGYQIFFFFFFFFSGLFFPHGVFLSRPFRVKFIYRAR